MKAEPVFKEKRVVTNQSTGEMAIAEIKIWGVSKSTHYPEGRKFSLFLVSQGRAVVGIDNHKPKGPHLHLGEEELSYSYSGDERLVTDFWDLVRKAGFEP